MGIKSRLYKLEQRLKTDDNEIILIIDDIVTYRDKSYTQKEFYKLYSKYKDAEVVEIS